MGIKRDKTIVAAWMLIIGSGLFAATAAQAFLYAPIKDLEVTPPAGVREEWLPPEKGPVRLTIPAAGVDAPITHTGITQRGTMAVPASYHAAGWYRYGTAPGARGSAVVAGHVDNGAGLPAVFNRLESLRAGDEIVVETAEGERIVFVVEELRRYPYGEVPTETIFNRSDAARLNLITCAGQWLPQEETYAERLVVYAVRSS